ncbi:Uma2 family endonuclease [Kovacikia minuta CCNUW1]|uniref:Uma2 family endonuclease n=1 Tax=Kovacikia minuta TaxID=2931930 RepID=UPI001CCC05F7|nr:Uma2 family endonuclease [Kovacikia minuta]UBF25535.1 Uma2 family endonuclease [Kovacikia minuta CCNUW1]
MSSVQISAIAVAEAEIPTLPPCDLYSDEPPLETDLHLQQIILFLECLNWCWREKNDYYASANSTIYFSEKQLKNKDFRGPDFFVVLGVERHPRKSWVVWAEDGKTPNVIIEVLSKSTADVDRGLKKQHYQDVLKVYDYFWFDPDSLEFAGFCLVNGHYQSLQPNDQGWLWSEQLQLFLGIHQNKLRYFTPDGHLVPSPTEAALTAEQRAEQEAQRAERLAAKLRELNIDPDAL